MNNLSTKPISPRRYHQLFAAILTVYFVVTFFNIGEFEQFMIGCSLMIMIIFAIRTFPLHRPIKFAFRVLVIGAFSISFAELLIAQGLVHQILDFLSHIVYAFFLSLSILFLGRKINQAEVVDEDTLLGGISIYLLFGILWYIFYHLVYIFDQNAFSQNLEMPNYHLLYFSFTTLTTLGYGDISPVNKIAMGLTNTEAIIGQLYPAIFLARLVSLYIVPDSE
ncbi:MAG: ion channel [Microcystaceae cyanobacterium]